jgi:hypothetical protein
MTNVASATSHFPKPQKGFTTTLNGTISAGATSLLLNAAGSYANGDVVVLIIDPGLATQQTFTGVLNTATLTVAGVVWTDGTNVSHANGATVVDWMSAADIALISKGMLVGHSQAGDHTMSQVLSTQLRAILKFVSSGTSAVNELSVQNAVTGNAPSLSATGTDTNIGLDLISKGTGEVKLNGVNASGAWGTWSPTLTGVTIGNGSVVARYKQIGKSVFFTCIITFGNTTAITAAPRISTPVAANGSYVTGSVLTGYGSIVGTVNAKDDSASSYFGGSAVLVTVNQLSLDLWNTAGTYLAGVSISSTVPFTWTTNDTLTATGVYETP